MVFGTDKYDNTLATVRVYWKNIIDANTLAYFHAASMTKKKSFITLTHCVSFIIRLFTSLLTVGQNKLERLSLASIFNSKTTAKAYHGYQNSQKILGWAKENITFNFSC